MRVNNLCVSNGRVWQKSALHLKSAIPNFDSKDIVKKIELDQLKRSL